MHDLKAAGEKLRAQHTVRAPKLSFAEAAHVLAGVDAKSPTDLLRPEARQAALAFLIYRFTALAPHLVDPDIDVRQVLGISFDAVRRGEPQDRQDFVEQVLFNVAHPADHGALWPLVIDIVPADVLEELLLNRAASDNELHVHNALHIPYYIFGRAPGYALSSAGRAALQGIVAGLRARDAVNVLVRLAAEDFQIPADR